jgi:integrase
MKTRHHNRGLRKVCGCARRTWAKCPHSWHFNFKPKGGASYRFSVDSEAPDGKHVAAKGDAETLADGWRSAIRAGTFRRRSELGSVADPSSTSDVLTLAQFIDRYFERRGKPATKNDTSCRARFEAFTPDRMLPIGNTPITAITEDTIEVFFAGLRAEGLAASTRNKYIQFVKAMFRWATKKGYLTRNPTSDSDALKREKHAQRDRRLEPGEEAALLKHAGAHLQRLIIGAIESCCRQGELLSLTWRDVNLDRREMTIRAERTKTKTGRVLPISDRLVGVLEMAKTDPAGQDLRA